MTVDCNALQQYQRLHKHRTLRTEKHTAAWASRQMVDKNGLIVDSWMTKQDSMRQSSGIGFSARSDPSTLK